MVNLVLEPQDGELVVKEAQSDRVLEVLYGRELLLICERGALCLDPVSEEAVAEVVAEV